MINLRFLLNIFTTNLLIISSLFSQERQDHIAVLNLDPIGVTYSESITLTDRLRGELVRSGKFTVIERSEMRSILEEQGFQQSGCTSDECAVEIGKLLNIHMIVAGGIGKVGSLYTITLRVIDVETGEILLSITEDCECPIESILKDTMAKLAFTLAQKSVDLLSDKSLSGFGDVYLKSDPAGAQVYLDGNNTGLFTPTTIKNLDIGKHVIKVVKDDIVGSKIVVVIANKISNEVIKLGKATGGIKIYSNPAEANISINNKSYGKTPKVVSDLAEGDYLVKISKQGFIDKVDQIKISGDEYLTIESDLIKSASLKITSSPSDAMVFIRGEEKENTPLDVEGLKPEKVLVEVVHPNFQKEIKYVTLVGGQIHKEHFTLKPKTGFISFNTNTNGIAISIDNDKEEIIKEDKKFSLSYGSHKLNYSKPGYEVYSESFLVDKGLSIINLSLEEKSIGNALFRSALFPGWGQNYQEKKTSSYVYSTLYAVGIISSVVTIYNHSEDIDQYEISRDLYNASFSQEDIDVNREKMYKDYDAVESSEKIQNYFLIATGAVWLWNIADLFLFPPDWQSDYSLSLKSKNNFQLGMNITF